MRFISPDVVVLDPWAAVAAEYRGHAPRRGDFSLPLPYQATKVDGRGSHSIAVGAPDVPSCSGSGTAAPSSAEAGAAGGASLLAAQQYEGCGSGRQAKKRKQTGSYQPNERELEAAARHAAVAPQLAAAAAAVQEWLHASGAPTVQQALQAANGAPGSQQRGAGGVAREAAAAARADADKTATAVEPAAGDATREPAAVEQPAAVGTAMEPDYRALFELRYTLKPKLQFVSQAAAPAAAAGAPASGAAPAAARAGVAAAAEAGAAAAEQCGTPAAVACARAQDAQRPAVILFNRLHSSEEGLSAYSSSSSGSDAGRSSGRGSDAGRSSRGGRGSRGSEAERLAWAGGHPVLLPPRSRFLMSDARQLAPLVADAQESGGYHCIVLDPPWENASAKRSARYPTLPSRNLLGLPLRQLMCQSGCLVAIWITNRERHRRFIDAELLPGWGLRHLATWHWLKVTDGGQLVSRLDVEHRRPYEALLLCWPAHLPPPPGLPASGQQRQCSCADEQGSAAGAAGAPFSQAAAVVAAGGAAGAAAAEEPGEAAAQQACPGSSGAPGVADNGFHLLQGRPLVVAAVPPAAHSRKPHLGPLLLPLLPPNAQCLEMFARELHAGWTSWGNEALKFQSTIWFEPSLQLEGSLPGALLPDETCTV